MLEEQLESKRQDEKLFRDILLKQTGLLVEQKETNPEIPVRAPISRSRSLHELSDAVEQQWRDREKEILASGKK